MNAFLVANAAIGTSAQTAEEEEEGTRRQGKRAQQKAAAEPTAGEKAGKVQTAKSILFQGRSF